MLRYLEASKSRMNPCRRPNIVIDDIIDWGKFPKRLRTRSIISDKF